MKRFISMITALSLAAASFGAIYVSAAASDWTTEGTAVINGDTAELRGDARVSRVYSGLENGTYNLTVSVTNSDISGTAYVYARTEGHTAALTAIPQYSTAQNITVPGIIVDNGSCEVGVYVSGAGTVTAGGFTLSPCEETRVPFLKGGEISKLTYVEDNGGKFYRADGTEGDALQIMAENGFNLARIRVLCDPGKGHGNGTYYLPAGYMTEEDCLELARRAKSKGMQIEWTFAYSDWWVDGGEQYPPHEWLEGAAGLSGSALADYYADKIYEYTKKVLQDLKAQDTEPEYVSIGNEMQCGMCFGSWQNNNGLYYKDTYLVQLANAGAKAVREECPDAKIIMHTDNGGKVLTGRPLFTKALSSFDFDVIGVSYYPYYNADVSVDTVVAEFNKMISAYDKDVIIMETGYNWNDVRGDGWEGQLQNSGYYQNIYGETQAGQRA
ncbi:MAG: glycosyl hydrolase 53 family protein, partial [Candidatus Ornithomonoglobus sp.]